MKNNQDQELQILLHNMESKTFDIERNQNHVHVPAINKNIKEKTWDESKKMWAIAAPAILATVAQFSMGVVTVAFVGHLGEVELAAVSIVQNVLEGFVYGIMVRICYDI